MTNHRIIKFLTGCGIASLLLAGCGSDNNGTGGLKSAPETQAATVGVFTVMEGGLDPTGVLKNAFDDGFSMGSPEASLLLAKNHSAKVKALKALSVKSKLLGPPIGEPMDCDLGGTYTVTAYTSDPYLFSESYDQCKNILYEGMTEVGYTIKNGFRSESSSTDVNDITTNIQQAGNMNGTADMATDFSTTYVYNSSDDRIEVLDLNTKDVYYDGGAPYLDQEYSGSTKGQLIVNEEMGIYKITADIKESGIESDDDEGTYTDEYSFSGSNRADVSYFFFGETTISAALTANMSGTYREYMDGWDDSPSGNMTINLSMPAYDCAAINGTYKVQNIEPVTYDDFDGGLVSGEVLINGNTTVTITPVDYLTITRDNGETVDFEGDIDDLMDIQTITCPLVSGELFFGPI